MVKEQLTGKITQQHINHILIVEDDADMGDALVAICQVAMICQPYLVHDGLEALHYAEHLKPDLLLLDYQLPGMDGLTLYDTLHAMEGMEHIPAIFLSANLPIKALQERSLIGIDKPLDLDQFIEIIQAQMT